MDLARAVVTAGVATGRVQELSQLKTLQDLTDSRKLFKHSGLVVDAQENSHLFKDVVHILEELTTALLNVSLLKVDSLSLVVDDNVRGWFSSAREQIASCAYKDALESIAWGLANAFSMLPLSVGRPSSDEALVISGRGVDPGPFLAMQRLLPITHLSSEEPRWTLREFGHPANWTQENAQFCWDVAVDTVSKLQRSIAQPEATDFYDVYEDVVSVEVDNPEAYVGETFLFSNHPGNERKVELKRDDRITGRATGRFDRTSSLTTDTEALLEYAEWIAVRSPSLNGVEVAQEYYNNYNQIVWVKREEVTVTYQLEPGREKLRTYSRERNSEI